MLVPLGRASMAPPRLGVALLVSCLPSAPSLVTVADGPALSANPGPYRQELRSEDGFEQYKGLLMLGGQPLHGVMDTGSAELVVISDRCGGFLCPQEEQYHAGDSGSYRHGRETQTLTYSGGGFFTEEAYDDLELGPFKAADARFWEVTRSTMNLMMFGEFTFIAGLGPYAPPGPGPQGAMPPHRWAWPLARRQAPDHKAVLSKLLPIRAFSICLDQEKDDSAGYIVWNDDAHSSSPGLFKRLTTKASSHWMISLKNVRIGDRLIACGSGCGAIPDSGTAMLSMPPGAVQALNAEAKGWHLASACEGAGIQHYPRLNFELDGMEHSLPPSAYMGDIMEADLSSTCKPRVMEMNMTSDHGDVWVLGMPFFREYYSVFVQGAGDSRPEVHTSRADGACRPSATGEGSHLRAGAERRVGARALNVSRLRPMPWLQAAIARGRLEED